MILGIIPARGGSKRIIGKNLKMFNGKPLLYWIIEAAKKSKIDHLVVTSDDPEIGAYAAKQCVHPVMRPPEMSRDNSSSEEALLHTINKLSIDYDKLVFLQCTSPGTTPEDIDACIDELDTHDCCFTVQETTSLLWDANGSINHDWRERPMSQDRVQYEETAAVYAMRMGGFLKHRYRFFGNMAFHVTDRNIDIDTPEDFLMAEALCASKS
jgi:CMP-N-acetylneuraminic acid synthetase